MARFSYKARDGAGKTTEAVVEAPTRKEALRTLAARGLSVVAVTELAAAGPERKAAAAAAPEAPVVRSDATPRGGELLPFLEALHDLTSSGLSAGEAVRLLSVRIKEPRLRTLAAGLWARLGEGAPLSRAMDAYPLVFDSATVNLIRAGEATGSLNDTLVRLIEHLRERREMRQQLIAAMAYPVFMVVMSFAVILFFLFFLLPRLQSLLSSLGAKLPLSTRLLVGSSQFVIHYGLFLFAAAVLGLASFLKWRATEAGREKSDAWLLRLPLVGPFLVARTVLAFSETLGVLLENGITAAEALRMTERQIEIVPHRKAFGRAIERVLEGESLSSALTRTGCFPELVLDRLAVGENTGNVAPSLRSIAGAYRKLISRQLNLFTRVIASTLLAFVFIFVAFIAFSIVQAVFTVSTSLQMH